MPCCGIGLASGFRWHWVGTENNCEEAAVRSISRLVVSFALSVGVGAAGSLSPTASFAQTLAGKQLRLIVPAPPGGGFDSLARLVATKVSENLKTSVIVENRPGAGQQIGTAVAARAAPDGTTILMVGTNFTTNPLFNRNLPYDALKDFEPVMIMAQTPFMLVATRTLPVTTPQEFVAYAKAHPGRLSYTATQPRGAAQLAAELLKLDAGINMTFVPYQGSAPALTDLMAGRVQVMVDAPVTSMPHVKAGALHALALTSATRSPYLPDIPTLAESGWPHIDVTAWAGLVVPARTPKEDVAWLNAAFTKALSDPQLQKALAAQYWVVTPSSPAETRKFLDKEMKRWADLVARAKLTVN
ncbi:hypothetical protein CEY11_19775 [Candidimonas nitroreducens]|uniref:ABC transporter substrate-binding protein n=1 Tax=Candidimonas nitroreducens TaxID=683354 RepID=A0A225M835_9BURK|nr:hypothetical protein CEY11_19775 [Candidimonas nitroreducens]